eukprot:11166873-Lingulodinium_polyedra.AAC.1
MARCARQLIRPRAYLYIVMGATARRQQASTGCVSSSQRAQKPASSRAASRFILNLSPLFVVLQSRMRGAGA